MRREQFNKRGRYSSPILLVLVMLFLTACAHTSKDDPNKDHLGILTQSVVNTKITIGTAAKTTDETLEFESRLVQVLNDFGAVGSNLKEKIEDLQNANGDATTGLGGIYGHIFLDDAKERLLKTGQDKGKWNGEVSVTQDVFGQITDYNRNETTGAGLFHVTTLVVTTLISPNGPPIKKVAYHWQVEVEPGGFSVHKNCLTDTNVACDPANPEQPFPGTMWLDANMRQTVVDRNFDYKLWAKGTKIKVKKVYFRNNPGTSIPAPPPVSGPTGPWQLLDNSPGSIYQGLYTTSIDSCIDMMTEDIPPTDITNLPPVPFYCLGRCDQPAIVNSR